MVAAKSSDNRIFPCDGRAIAYISGMTIMMSAEEMVALRKRLGWSQRELARRLGISPSRVADYELGHTRGKKERAAPIPRVVEIALRSLAPDP